MMYKDVGGGGAKLRSSTNNLILHVKGKLKSILSVKKCWALKNHFNFPFTYYRLLLDGKLVPWRARGERGNTDTNFLSNATGNGDRKCI